MGTKRNPSRFDCYARLADDEPYFLLRAHDRHAELLVRAWAMIREFEGEDRAVLYEARECAAGMATWLLEHGRPPFADHLTARILQAIARELHRLSVERQPELKL